MEKPKSQIAYGVRIYKADEMDMYLAEQKVFNVADGYDINEKEWRRKNFGIFKEIIEDLDMRINGYGEYSKEGLCLSHFKDFLIRGKAYPKEVLSDNKPPKPHEDHKAVEKQTSEIVRKLPTKKIQTKEELLKLKKDGFPVLAETYNAAPSEKDLEKKHD